MAALRDVMICTYLHPLVVICVRDCESRAKLLPLRCVEPGTAEKGPMIRIDPADIYFTFSRIRPKFSCGRSVHETIAALELGILDTADVPPIALLVDGAGNYYSLNNRRLYCFKELRSRGLIETVVARVKPVPNTRRMKDKYSPEKCSKAATLMPQRSDCAAGDGDAERTESDHDDELAFDKPDNVRWPPTADAANTESQPKPVTPASSGGKKKAQSAPAQPRQKSVSAGLADELAALGIGDDSDDDDNRTRKGPKKGKRK